MNTENVSVTFKGYDAFELVGVISEAISAYLDEKQYAESEELIDEASEQAEGAQALLNKLNDQLDQQMRQQQ